jgi:hypothetical protein
MTVERAVHDLQGPVGMHILLAGHWRLTGLGCLLVALACGGRVDNSTDPGSNPSGLMGDSGANSDGSSNQSSAISTSTSSSTTSGVGTAPLAACSPGMPMNQATADTPCGYVVGTTCYSIMDDACGCACPRDQGHVLCVATDGPTVAGAEALLVVCGKAP